MKESFTKTLKCCANPEEFPKLAKEMGFSFHLRRGRVNWHKIDAIDIDRIIQERDLATLQENLLSIINYSLDAEYDVKILDPSFVKLFKLAQLSIDYLMYSEQHVYNCVQLAQDEIFKLSAEVQRLQKECKKKDLQQRSLKKHVKDLERLRMQDYQQVCLEQVTTDAGAHAQCQLCGKVFRTTAFLQLHHGRRHSDHPPPTTVATAASRDTERLQLELKELKERLNLTERLLQQEKDTHDKEQDDKKCWEEENKRRMAEWQESEQKKYREDLAAVQKLFLSEIQQVRENVGATAASLELAENVQKQEEKLSLLQEELGKKLSPSVEELHGQLTAQEQLWRTRLSDLEQQHGRDLQQLMARLAVAETDSAKVVAAYESKIQSLMSHLKQQELTLRSQGEQIAKLTSLSRVNTAAGQVVQHSSFHASIVQSPGGDNNFGSVTPVKPFLTDEPPSSIKESAPQSVIDTRQCAMQPESVHSSRDSGLDSPRRAAPHVPGSAADLATEYQCARREEQTEESDDTVSEETSASSESESQQEETNHLVSVPSLQEAVQLNPNLLTELRGDLQSILERRLRELGVDPEWQGVPSATFKHKMATVTHQQNITAKRYNNFFKLKESLKKKVDGTVAVRGKDVTGRRVKGHYVRSSSLARMMGNVRYKALGILQRSTQRRHNNSRSAALARTSTKSSLMATDRSQKQVDQVSEMRASSLGDKSASSRQPAPRHRPTPPQRDDAVAPDFGPRVTVVTSTPVRTSQSALAASIVESIDSGKAKNSSQSSSLDDVDSDASEAGPKDHETAKSVRTIWPSQRTTTPAASLDKKTVLLRDLTPPTEVESTTDDPRTLVSPARATTSVPDERPGEASVVIASKQKAAKSVKFSDDVKSSFTRTLDSDSDWGISSGDGDIIKAVDTSGAKTGTDTSLTIRLSTRQSDKIAQISKNIEHQLNVTRKKPVGGVAAMFSAGSAVAGGEAGNIKSLSDWDLEDFDDLISN